MDDTVADVFDIVIRNGTVIDGTGGPARRADVGIVGDKIVAVGTDLGPATREIDAAGLLVTPGWVDMHTHYDAQITWDPYLTPSGWNGVTTVVMGNCGVGFAPVAPDQHDWLIELMEGVEDIPGAAMHEGIQWEWESFPEYLDALSRREAVCDFATQVPHGALRAYVMGDRSIGGVATDADIDAMTSAVAEGLRAGALGFSTSRTPLHKSIHGELVPGTDAAATELYSIAHAMKDVGFGVFQGAIHHPDVPSQFGWMREVAAITGGNVTFNFSQTDEAPQLWREVLDLLDQAHADGLDITGQVAGRPIGILMSWDGTAHPFATRPSWGQAAMADPAARRALVATPEFRAQLLAEQPVELSPFITFITTSWHKMWPFTGDTSYEPDPTGTVAAIAEREGRDPAEVAYDHLCTEGGKGILYFPLFNYSDQTLDPLWQLHQHPRTRMGLADGGAHCASICDGSMPTFMASFWSRDRSRGANIALEHIVHRQTQQTAAHYGLLDRGVIAAGYRADINVIDFAELGVEHPEMAWDLPTGAKRYVQRVRGYRATLCRGVLVADNGEFTGETPGRLVRGPQPAPAEQLAPVSVG